MPKMRVSVLSLLAIAAAHGATTPAWGSGRMPALRMAEAAPASNLALRGGVVEFVKGAVNSMKQAVCELRGSCSASLGLPECEPGCRAPGAVSVLYSLAGTAVRGRPPCECVGVAGGRVWLGVRAVSERAVTNNGVGGAGRRAEEDR